MNLRTLARAGALTVLATTMAFGAAGAAQAQTFFGKGFEKWSFTQTDEKNGVVNCRAIRKGSGREDIVAMRTNGDHYISVAAQGRKGKHPNSIVTSGGIEWIIYAEANGQRLWFTPFLEGALDVIMAEGSYEFYLADSEDMDTVNLGTRSYEALERLRQCVAANGG